MRKFPWQASFLLLALIWGCSFWWIKESLVALTPLQVAFSRCVLGALVLWALVAVARPVLPSRSLWKHLMVVALLFNSVPFTLFALGQTQVSSILAGIINATTPLWTLVITMLAFQEERPTRQRVIGLGVGFIGVLTLLGVWQSLPTGQWLGIAACLGATLCYGIAFPYARRYIAPSGTPPVSLAAAQVLLGAAFLLPVVAVEAVTEGSYAPQLTIQVGAAMLALGALGTGIAYIFSFSIIRAAGSSTAASVTYLTPIVAVVVGLLILGEPITWYEPVGAAIVLFGIAYSQGRIRQSGSIQSANGGGR
jgi:drug/metabolite transporter (DMT)-like permease